MEYREGAITPFGQPYIWNKDGGKETTVGNEGGDSDEGGEEGNLAFTSERKGIGPEGAVHDPLNRRDTTQCIQQQKSVR